MPCNQDCNQGRKCDCECKMTKDEALRMAIEAFGTLMMENGSVYQKTIQACKEALAEQPLNGIELEWYCKGWDDAEKDLATQEPIGEVKENGVTWYKQNPHAHPIGTKFYTTPPSREWVGLSDECQCQACVKGIRHDSDCAVHNAPAYPVGECNCSVVDKKQWVGLSNEEVQEVLKEMWDKGTIPSYSIVKFASAIEAKLRDKNNG